MAHESIDHKIQLYTFACARRAGKVTGSKVTGNRNALILKLTTASEYVLNALTYAVLRFNQDFRKRASNNGRPRPEKRGTRVR